MVFLGEKKWRYGFELTKEVSVWHIASHVVPLPALEALCQACTSKGLRMHDRGLFVIALTLQPLLLSFCIRPYLDHKTASTIATSVVHSKLDYCNSLYYNLPNTQLDRLQHIQNSLARAVVWTPNPLTSTRFSKLYTGLKLSSA